MFNVGHDLVTAIETQEVGFPFEQVTLTGHTKERLNQTSTPPCRTPSPTPTSAPGVNLGLDVAYFGLRELGFLGGSGRLDHIALAFVLRYSRGTSAVVRDGGFQPSFELGGTHLGAGLRVGFSDTLDRNPRPDRGHGESTWNIQGHEWNDKQCCQ